MANAIRIKRRAHGNATGAPASLLNAELAYNESDAGSGILYYGFGAGGAGGSATQVVAIGGDGAFVSLTGSQSISGNKSFSGQINLSSATVSGFTVTGNLVVNGNFTVSGTTTFVNSQTIEVRDKNIELGKVGTPSDVTADGGGLSLLGDTTKTISWVNATDAWTFSEHLDIASGKSYRINGTEVLSASALGSGITSSSLTSLGTVTTGTWSATTIALNKGGTGATDAETARANLGIAIGTNVQPYDIELAAIAGLTSAADKLPYFTGSGTASLADFSSFGRSLVDDVDASAARTTLGLGTMATQAASNVAITGGSISGVEIDGGSY